MGLFCQYWTQRKQIQESEYFTQELSLAINYSSCVVQYPHYPIACCLPHRTSMVAHNCHGKSTLTSRQTEKDSRQKSFCRESYSFCGDVIVDALGKHPLCHRMCKVTKETSGANNIMRNAIDSTSMTFRWTSSSSRQSVFSTTTIAKKTEENGSQSRKSDYLVKIGPWTLEPLLG